jgi:hypothetical protein
MRPMERYHALLEREGLRLGPTYPTHVLLNRDLGPWRFLNRAPGLLLFIDRAVLAMGLGRIGDFNQLLVATRT